MIVVDASVFGNALLDEGQVGRLSRRTLAEDLHWAAPEHLITEVFSVIRGRSLGGHVTPDRARHARDALTKMAISLMPVRELVDRMWELRHNLSAYDAAYVALAERLDCPLITADKRLARADGVRCTVRVLATV